MWSGLLILASVVFAFDLFVELQLYVQIFFRLSGMVDPCIYQVISLLLLFK